MKMTALITGATSGIGKATARIFAEQGKKLILCGRREALLKSLADELSQKTEVHTLVFDVRKFEEVEKAINSIPEEFSTINILVNSAGNAHGLDLLEDASIEDLDAMIDGNVQGLLYVSKLIIPRLKEQKSGHIVNISSIAALRTYRNGIAYSASKRAVDGISEGMRAELTEFGIKVTNIRPGAVATEFSEVRFKGDKARAAAVYEGYEALLAEDIADVISYCVNLPNRVSISDLTIYPKTQLEAQTIYKTL
ncbi:SDR family NAD(P)-dependent oxidoreductase [Cruoricaptor ignavus]|nr:SDR family NAD(P)-dependent oxidoreductase [Cruoricaptor ignavus]